MKVRPCFVHISHVRIKLRCHHMQSSTCCNKHLLTGHIKRGRDLLSFCTCFTHVLDVGEHYLGASSIAYITSD